MNVHFDGPLSAHDLSFSNLTEQDAEALIERIIEESGIDSDEFYRQHIPVDVAAEVAFANPKVCRDYFEDNGVDPDLAMEHMNAKEMAYYVAFNNHEFGTKLLDELLYYRKHGRI